MRAAERLGPWLDRARGVLDVERKPFRSLGFAASVLVTVAFLIGLPFAAS